MVRARCEGDRENERVRAINIFDVIGKTTRRIEPFHSEFLAEALRVSATGNRSLFDAVWKLAAPEGWDVPHEPRIESEKRLEDGKRIDICIFDQSQGRLVGIEVKTTKASAETGQLEAYLRGLCAKYGYEKNAEERVGSDRHPTAAVAFLAEATVYGNVR